MDSMNQQPAYMKWIMPLAYKVNTNVYLPSGLNQRLSCNHEFLGVWGVNMAGEEVPLPTTTIPPLSATPGNTLQSAEALIQVGNVWVDSTYFGDASFKVVAKVKDYETNNVMYLDAASYNAQLPDCNWVPQPSFCPLVTVLAAGSITSSAATISWTAVPGSTGVEWVNNTMSGDPAGDGSYLDAATATVALTGLTTGTTYYFHIRTICGAGSRSAWTKVSYTTS